MIKGTVKFFNNAKGFGFITPDDGGKDVFVPAATITASGTSRLKAGQRVSFETEPDPKGPKAVRLTLLDEAPREVPAKEALPKELVPKETQPRRQPISLYCDPASDDSADVLEALRADGHEPRLVDVILTPPGRDELKQLSMLLRQADQSLVRRYDALFLELQLDDRFISENEFWTAIVEHPQLINTPVLAAHGKARLARSETEVRAFLGGEAEKKPKGISPRMAALMQGRPVPPAPVVETKSEARSETRTETREVQKAPEPAPQPKIATQTVLNFGAAPNIASKTTLKLTPKAAQPAAPVPAPVPASVPEAAKPKAKKALAPAKKAVAKAPAKPVKKAAAKPVKKAAPAKKKKAK